jgi:beta-glucosidase
MESICQPLDFYGANIYVGFRVRAAADERPEVIEFPVGYPLTMPLWPVTPEAMYWGLRFLYERYRLPILVTENGMSNADWPSADGGVHDPQRIDFLRRYLKELGRAISDGVDVRGYFHWSSTDNFEWADGHMQRYGLVYVDFPTQKRIIKDSARWFAEVIASNGATVSN